MSFSNSTQRESSFQPSQRVRCTLVRVHCAGLDSWSDEDLPLSDEVPAQPNNHASSPQNAAPVHRLGGDGNRDGEERERPGDGKPATGDDVDSQAPFSEVPRSHGHWTMCCSPPCQKCDGNEVRAEITCNCQRDDSIECDNGTDVDQTQEY